MNETSTVRGGAQVTPRKHREEPDLWQEDDIPTDDNTDGGEAREDGRVREAPDRQTDTPRE